MEARYWRRGGGANVERLHEGTAAVLINVLVRLQHGWTCIRCLSMLLSLIIFGHDHDIQMLGSVLKYHDGKCPIGLVHDNSIYDRTLGRSSWPTFSSSRPRSIILANSVLRLRVPSAAAIFAAVIAASAGAGDRRRVAIAVHSSLTSGNIHRRLAGVESPKATCASTPN